jgi:hypothetical protein
MQGDINEAVAKGKKYDDLLKANYYSELTNSDGTASVGTYTSKQTIEGLVNGAIGVAGEIGKSAYINRNQLEDIIKQLGLAEG